MKLLKSLCAAFSMYSKIPVPRTELTEDNIKYAMCFFPLIGVVIGACEIAVFWLCNKFGFGDISRAAIMTAVPVIISGGIHLDGFLDTSDALSSYGDREKKLEILKDPHTGAFAVIKACLYFLLYFASMTEIDNMTALWAVCVGFVLSRALSGLAVAVFKCAKDSGLLHAFHGAAHKKAVTAVMILYIIICAVLLIFARWYGAGVLAVCAIAFVWYRYIAYSKFGGATGDVAGYFVCVCELMCVIMGGLLCVLL